MYRMLLFYFLTLPLTFVLSANEVSRKEDYEKGLEYYRLGQFDEAAKHLERFLANNPNDDEVMRRLNESSSMALVEMQHNEKLRGISRRILEIPENTQRQQKLDDERTLELIRDIERRQYSREGEILRATWDAQRKLQLVGAPAVPFLIKHLGDTHEDTLRSVVFQTLVQIDDQAVLPLIKALQHPNEFIQANVASVLGQIKDPLATPALKGLWETTESEFVKKSCEQALYNTTGQNAGSLPSARLLHLKQADDYLHSHPRVMRQIDDDLYLIWSFDSETNSVRRTEVPGYIWHLELAEDACFNALQTPGNLADDDIYPLLTVVFYSQLEMIENLIDKGKAQGENIETLVGHHKNLRKADMFGPLFGVRSLQTALKVAMDKNNSGVAKRINRALVAIRANLSGTEE